MVDHIQQHTQSIIGLLQAQALKNGRNARLLATQRCDQHLIIEEVIKELEKIGISARYAWSGSREDESVHNVIEVDAMGVNLPDWLFDLTNGQQPPKAIPASVVAKNQGNTVTVPKELLEKILPLLPVGSPLETQVSQLLK